ncbi:phytanoyl-CoA dioxygenase family protein [Paenibacillus nasutitermitis]|uniref:Phytanoyl-CoA dioxygenase n=1 Tax=Paenibacillus nasutitermitis TaxID=1652958 RepID=A0A916YLV7_9BACL|nr:phytanoyl-CoA dioxygenase family protein [Paenibacillus nasutitermitis]GGD51611.1 hypothetical protein GCM10010911_06460 [Paenibacillus nasutitermitis]
MTNAWNETTGLKELEDSAPLLGDLPGLRLRLQESGYLFFRGLFEPEALLRIREDMLRTANKHGILKEGKELMDAIYAGGEIPTSYKFEASLLYRDMLEQERFNAFGSHPLLALLLGGLLNGPIREHRRRIARITFPGSFGNTTPIHQDHYYIRGAMDTYTCWIPCGDCPAELGGLAVLEGSHKLGFLPHVPMSGTGGRGIEETEAIRDGKWLSTDYRLGDLLLFHGLTLHKALHNITPDKLRLSLEYRLQRSGDPIDDASLRSHYTADSIG